MYIYPVIILITFSNIRTFSSTSLKNFTETFCEPNDDCETCFDGQNSTVYCMAEKQCCSNSSYCADAIDSKDKCVSNINDVTTFVSIEPDTPAVTDNTTESPKTEPTVSTDFSSPAVTVPSKTTVAPGRHFDAPSFIGGIVLALGLLAIIYVSFKFYKARTERNYHTL